MPPCGRQPGAGRPKGSVERKTVEETAALELMRQMAGARIGPVTEAQLDEAEGSRYVVVRSPHDGYRRLTDEQQIEAASASGETS